MSDISEMFLKSCGEVSLCFTDLLFLTTGPFQEIDDIQTLFVWQLTSFAILYSRLFWGSMSRLLMSLQVRQQSCFFEKQILNLLQNNQHIVVKPADKGSAIVIMNRTDYITEATRQLSDNKFYTKIPMDLTGLHIDKMTQTLSTMLRNDEIAQSVYCSLVPKDCKTPAFYFLPKIHKQNIMGRPIISGNNSPTEKISAFVDEHIKQFVPSVKS